VTPARILVLGGGYVPVALTRELRDAVRAGAAEVTVVTRTNFHVFHGFIAEMITGRVSPSHILSPVRRIFASARVHVAEIEAIDLDARRVVTSRHLDGARFELAYDELVLAVGSAENLEAYPGLAEHAFRLKAYRDCLALKNHVLEMFELADIERDAEERRRLLTFFVAGGGYAGTEIAAELADFVRLLTAGEYPGIRRDECRVVLVHPDATILPELYGSSSTEQRGRNYRELVEWATRHVRGLGVEILTETRVTAVTPNEVHLSGGVVIPTRTVVSAVGTKPQPVLDGLDLPRDARGRVATDAFLRVPGRPGLWAGGDCAAVPHPSGGTCPPVGIFALAHGRQIGRNLSNTLRGRPPGPFTYTGLGQGVSIGHRTAVGELKGVPLRGLLCWTLWRGTLFYFFPTWDRRLRLLADWSIWPVVGRDIVQLDHGGRGDYEVRHYVHQPGEAIAERRRPVRYVHVIVEGEAEVVAASGDVLSTLGPGDHFGRKWLETAGGDVVRARSLVRTVALRADQANRLQDVLASAGRLIARTGAFPIVDDERLEREAG
jgi:NADH dehydrogenase